LPSLLNPPGADNAVPGNLAGAVVGQGPDVVGQAIPRGEVQLDEVGGNVGDEGIYTYKMELIVTQKG
jgi:hypothetical protein